MDKKEVNFVRSSSRGRVFEFPFFIRLFGFATAVTLATIFIITLASGVSTTVGTNISTNGTLTVSGVTTLTNASTTGMLTVGTGFISSASSTIVGSLTVSESISTFSSVGVGTTSPNIGNHSMALTVARDISGARSALEIAGNTNNAHAVIEFYNNRALTGYIESRGANGLADINFFPDNHVGIGTSTPGQLLAVQGNALIAGSLTGVTNITATGSLTFVNSSTTTIPNNAVNVFSFATSTSVTPVISIDTTNGGRVGIGTVAPSDKLNVVGNIVTSGVTDARFFSNSNSVSSGMAGLTGQLINSGTVEGRFHLLLVSTSSAASSHLSTAVQYDTYLTTSGEGSVYGNLLFAVGNSEKMRIASTTGNVGIGTTTPNWNLQVAGTRPSIALSDTGAGGTNLKHWLLSSMGGNLYVGTSTDAYGTSTPPAITITNSGNVGIGSTLPTTKLYVVGEIQAVGASDARIYSIPLSNGTFAGFTANFEDGNGGFHLASPRTGATSHVTTVGNYDTYLSTRYSGNNLIFATNNTERVRIDGSNGNFGIGTTTPGRLLAVHGNAIVSGTLNVANITATGTLTLSGRTSTSSIMHVLGIGTTTPNWALQIATTSNNSRIQLALTDPNAGTDLKHWTLSSQGGNFYIATSSDAYATSSIPALMIDRNGNVGIGTTTRAVAGAARLSIEGNCIDNNTAEAVGCVDYAELYPSTEEVEPGDVLALDKDHSGNVKKAKSGDNFLIGAVSSNPAIVIEGSALRFLNGTGYQSNPYKPALALAGRIPVKINLEGGEIKIGDPLTVSSVSGVAKKITEPGPIIGYALENYSEMSNVGKIMMFIQNTRWEAPPSITDIPGVAQIIDIVKGWLESMKMFIEDGLVRLKNLIAETIIAKKITVDQLELKDRLTGSLYCVTIAGGELEKTAGNCPIGVASSTSSTTAETSTASTTQP